MDFGALVLKTQDFEFGLVQSSNRRWGNWFRFQRLMHLSFFSINARQKKFGRALSGSLWDHQSSTGSWVPPDFCSSALQSRGPYYEPDWVYSKQACTSYSDWSLTIISNSHNSLNSNWLGWVKLSLVEFQNNGQFAILFPPQFHKPKPFFIVKKKKKKRNKSTQITHIW